MGIVRKTDLCSGHDGFAPRSASEYSSDVFVNGLNVVREGDLWSQHCNDSCHTGVGIGSATVYVNSRKAIKKGDAIDCGSTTNGSSSDVFASE
jgi:uncharacterized Zn-binding protein involved in type VI secretion